MGVARAGNFKTVGQSNAQIIGGSLRFSSSRPTVLLRRPSVAGNQKTFTYSCWVKRTLLTGQSGGHTLFAVSGSSSSTQFVFDFMGTSAGNPNALETFTYSSPLQTSTSAVFRDTSAWYHVVLAIDTTQSVASAQAKYYVNGVQQTLGVANAFTQNADTAINGTRMHSIGSLQGGTDSNQSNYDADFYLSQVYFIDGQALNPSYFGYTDPLTNTWRPKKLSSSIAFGTNGFYLPFDGNSPIGKDMSGKGNDWTPVNFGGSNTLEKATGALPILNTDGGGKVARVGVRTDSNASSLVLALPLVGITSDFSNRINGGSTQKTITVNGSPTGNSTTTSNFYSQSYKFAGSDSFGCGTSSDFQMTGDFTLECWIYPVDTTDRSVFVTYDGSNYFAFNVQPGTGFNVYPSAGATNITDIVPYTNGWQHIALVRSGSSIFTFLNGIRSSTTITNSSTIGYNNQIFYVGGLGTQSIGSYNGYIQDVRVYKGLAKYTQNFIPASTDPDILPDTPSGVAYSSNVALVPSTDGSFFFSGPNSAIQDASPGYTVGTSAYTFECWAMARSWGDSNIIGLFGFQFGRYASNNGIGIAYATWELYTDWLPSTNLWYHYAITRDGSGVTRLFINGNLEVSATINTNYGAPTTAAVGGGPQSTPLNGFDGFISNARFVLGSALYTAKFTPSSTPLESTGAQTKFLGCQSNSSTSSIAVNSGTVSVKGTINASNFNPFTVNINTQRGQESGYCTWNPLDSFATLSNGNLSITTPSSNFGTTRGTVGVSNGKWYFEHFVVSGATALGVRNVQDYQVNSQWAGYTSGSYIFYSENNGYNKKANNNVQTDYGTNFGAGSTLGVALDLDAGTITFYVNGISQGVAYTGLSGTFSPVISDGTNAGTISGDTNFGQKPFKFPPPAGFQPLALANTPRPTIVRPDQYVGVTTYTGNGATRSLNVGFKPDFSYFSVRSGTGYIKYIFDSVRGATKYLATSHVQGTNAEGTDTETLKSFDFNGVTIGNNAQMNESSANTWVSWHWKAGGNSNTFNINDIGYSTASAAGLTAGTITPTGASVNTKSGFSIITYTGTGANATISHGLGRAPAFVICKRRDTTGAWVTWHKSLTDATYYVLLNSTAGQSNTSGTLNWNSTAPSSTVISLGTSSDTNNLNGTFCIYAWAEIPGFSQFGSYTGNGSGNVAVDGPFINCNFRPAWILIKCTSSGQNWYLSDSNRNKFNGGENTKAIFPNSNAAERNAEIGIDFLSNGFKLRHGEGSINNSGDTYIYAAFAESPSFNLYGGQSNAR